MCNMSVGKSISRQLLSISKLTKVPHSVTEDGPGKDRLHACGSATEGCARTYSHCVCAHLRIPKPLNHTIASRHTSSSATFHHAPAPCHLLLQRPPLHMGSKWHPHPPSIRILTQPHQYMTSQ